ncbi:hypothetical protein GGR57DRAFT_253142 [Xylariaceae sp. FL1272]|nr:hypothetical protein GGR57DRAFT_253142 [Xylariaceae sp. FL1272]
MEASSLNTLPNGYVMERKASTGSILVETDIVVCEDNVKTLSPHPPPVRSACRSMSQLRVEGSPTEEPAEESNNGASPNRQVVSRPRSSPALAGGNGLHDVVEYDGFDNGYMDLIQFLKRPPPRSNYMSVPDSFSSSSEDDKWHKLKHKVLRQQRKNRKRPPTIKLPDSAVAATTIGGHRHIAISIPLQYSPLAALPASQYPVYDSIEAAFRREVESRFESCRSNPSERTGTVLNPVAEDRESLSSVAVSPGASLQLQEHQTALSPPPKRARPHSVALLPSQEQRYNPNKPRDVAKRRSLAGSGPVSRISDPTGAPESKPEPTSQHASWPSTGTGSRRKRDSYRYIPTIDPPASTRLSKRRSQPKATERIGDTEPSARGEEASISQHMPARGGSEGREVITTIPARHLGQTQIVLTLPSRTSSKRDKQKNVPADQHSNILTTDQDEPVASQGSSPSGDGSGNGGSGGSHGHRPRGSVAESLMTTTSSPKLLKAQTATAYRTIPIVAHPSGMEVESPLDLNFPQPPSGQAAQTPHVEAGFPPNTDTEERGRSRKERVREKKLRDMEKLKAEKEQEQTGIRASEPSATLEASDTFKTPSESPILGSFSSNSGSRTASLPPTLKEKMKQPERRPYSMGTTPRVPPVLLQTTGKHRTPKSAPPQPASSSSSSWDHDPDRTSYRRRRERQAQRDQREERKARQMAKMMAEENESLGRLSREEILRRYETLRETRIYETERRLRKLERNRDTWVRTVPLLLESVNTLLQEQQHLLQDARVTYAVPTSAGPSQHRRRRARSLEPSSSSLPSLQSPRHSRGPLETQRPFSMQSSSESRSSRWSREASGLRGGHLVPQPRLSPLLNEFDKGRKEPQIAAHRKEHEKPPQRRYKSTEALTITTPTEGDAGYFSNRSTDSIADDADQIEPIVRGLREAARLAHAIRTS